MRRSSEAEKSSDRTLRWVPASASEGKDRLCDRVVRHAVRGDIPALSALIETSVRVLHKESYSAAQIELALANVYGVDTVLIDDATYFAIDDDSTIVACGGWSRRATLYGGDIAAGRSDDLLDPQRDAAKIRAFFVRPSHVRRGLGTLLLQTCERAAVTMGFGRVELGSTLAGVPFYAARGYVEVARVAVPLPHGEDLPVVRMERRLRSYSPS